MSNIRELKKDINYVLGDIIEGVNFFEYSNDCSATLESNALVEEVFFTFDNLINRINIKKVDNKKAHFKQINLDLEIKANQLVTKLNDLK